MNREEIIEIFIDHHDCMGLDEEEIEDLMEDVPVEQMERWLIKIGYDL